jgi:predicted nuclease of predicted toxin-antitoxin system
VKLKLDENLGRVCVDLLVAAGHDVATVYSQRMCSATDFEVINACNSEERALVTLDLDFSNPLVFPPEKYCGIAVLRLPSRVSLDTIVAAVRTLIDALQKEDLKGRLWSVEAGRVRIYEPPD